MKGITKGIKFVHGKMTEGEITVDDLVDYRNETVPVFHAFDIAADCNENMFFIFGALFRFFRDLPVKDYIFSSLTSRNDSYEIIKQVGMKIVWEDTVAKENSDQKIHLRFYEGNFNAFLGKRWKTKKS